MSFCFGTQFTGLFQIVIVEKGFKGIYKQCVACFYYANIGFMYVYK